MDKTGPAGAVAIWEEDGANLAVKDINAQKFLGKSKLSITYGDTQSSPSTAAALATQAVSKHYAFVLPAPLSSSAVAMAPVLAKADQPTIFTQSGGSGVLLNKYIARMAPLQTALQPLTMKWLQSKGVKTVAVIDDSDNPTLVDMANKLKTEGSKYGLTVKGVSATTTTATDLSATVTSALNEGAQAIAMYVIQAQNATVATLATQGGFTGPIIAQEGAANGVLLAAGSAANGVTWATDFVAGHATTAIGKTFTTEYTKVYGSAPSNFAAEEYDAVWYAARALKAAGSTNNVKLAAALKSVGTKGFFGALGKDTVVNGQQDSPPVLVKWQNGTEVAYANQNP